MPSVVYGILGLAIFVEALERLHRRGASASIAAGITLAVLVLPIVIITSAEAIRAVPDASGRPASASGPPGGRSSAPTCCPTPRPGILTGTVLALARALGEAAPLILVGAVTGLLGRSAGLSFCRLLDPELADERFTAMPIIITTWAKLPEGRVHGAHGRRDHRPCWSSSCWSTRSPSSCATATRRRGRHDRARPSTDVPDRRRSAGDASWAAARRAPRSQPAPTTTDAALPVVFEVRDLSVYYGDFRAVRDVNLDVRSTRSPPSSARPAAARPPCCAASTA